MCGRHPDADGAAASREHVTSTTCPLCAEPDAHSILWADACCRVVNADHPDYPGYCRVVWSAHVREMSDLPAESREHLLDVVCGVERALRNIQNPDKINLASLGNQVPHLHWHVIPRFTDDAHFPDSIWAARKRTAVPRTVDRKTLIRELRAVLSD